jgi:hypothetical protein
VAASAVNGHKQSARIPQGRVERCGTLVGWSAPYGAIVPSRYTVRACRFSQLQSIERGAMREVLSKHPIDAPVWLKAVEFANRTLSPSKSAKAIKVGAEEAVVKASGTAPETIDTSQAELNEAASAGWLPSERRLSSGVSSIGVCRTCDAEPSVKACTSRRASEVSTVRQSSGSHLISSDGMVVEDADPSSPIAATTHGVTTAWMAEREQAEALLRAEIAAVRDEMRRGFHDVLNALNEGKQHER